MPDFEYAIRSYLKSLEGGGSSRDHDDYVAAVLEQSVRREAFGTSNQRGPRRLLENLFLGDARKRGETHQWMYDHKNLADLLARAGFVDIRRWSFGESGIAHWADYRLELDDVGGEYKPNTLYMEATA
ncbi:hypothetical protein AWC12_03455 [Mycolicibacterium iranicum]|uniref:Uncharacterized protein n=1 Tax=Mycolicibacterium iranicum TaxID=912594 RepID=A0A1X1WZ18_MYCIR|nr:hypothetical protein AWC12_03455 [Mycolicibacterium iranicum]